MVHYSFSNKSHSPIALLILKESSTKLYSLQHNQLKKTKKNRVLLKLLEYLSTVINFLSKSTLVVGFAFNPSSGPATDTVTTAFIIDKDEDGERKGREPPGEAKTIHTETIIQTWAITQECCQNGFENKTKVEGPVAHSLLDKGVTTGLGNDQICPLHDDNSNEVSSLACIFQNLTVSISLKIQE